jgi:hypothetical protein
LVLGLAQGERGAQNQERADQDDSHHGSLVSQCLQSSVEVPCRVDEPTADWTWLGGFGMT